MNRVISLLLGLSMLFLIVCNGNVTNTFAEMETGDVTDYAFSVDLDGITTLDELEDRIEEHLDDTIESLRSRWETLSAEIDTYEKYCENADTISAFYQTIEVEIEQMCIMLCEYSAASARMVLDSDLSSDDKYDALDGINDCLYDDARDEINNA